MLVINNLLKPNSIEEAYRLLKDNTKARILGGGAFLRLSKDLKLKTVIDLYHLGLNRIEETEEGYIIGAMTTLRDLEVHQELHALFSNSVENIVGVQLRNIATIGGTIYPKYAFSDLMTSLLVLETELVFEGRENCTLENYLLEDCVDRSILKYIHIKKKNIKTAFKSIRKSSSDYAVLNVAVSLCDGQFKIAVGARPKVSALANKAIAFINESSISKETIEEAAQIAADELTFGSNRLGSDSYRKQMSKVLIKRALMEVTSC